MDLLDGCAKVLCTIGNIVASDNSKCNAVLSAGQSLPGMGLENILATQSTGIITLDLTIPSFLRF